MKPKTLDDILVSLHLRPSQIARAKEEIVELFKGCVPDEQDGWKHSLEDATEVYGFNTCRSQTLKNMEKLC